MNKFSGLIITFNEEANIAQCIASLKRVCDDVVVVDSLSSDKTVQIARAAGATVLEQAFLGDGPQRSFGLPHCQHEWVINLDADERLDEDLVTLLQNSDFSLAGVEAFETPRRNFIGQRTTVYAGQYPDYVCRIFDRTKTDFSPVKTHTRITTKQTRKLAGHVIHYSFSDYLDMFTKCQKYARWQGGVLAEKGEKLSSWSPVTHGFWMFFRLYILKRGFMAGLDGLTIALAKSISSYMKYAIAIELMRTKH